MRISDWSSDVCSSDLWSASGSLAYDTRVGGLTLRPMVAVDYFKLKEDGYQETGGGEALDLTVLSRDSDDLAVSGTMKLGLAFGGEIGGASCRERVCLYVWISMGDVELQNKETLQELNKVRTSQTRENKRKNT